MFERIIHRWLRVPYRLHVRQLQNPRKPRATVVLIHGIGSSSLMWRRLMQSKLVAKDVRVIAIDLLGFGKSPRPHWKTYDVATQTKSLATTLLAEKITGPVVLVGHSLGALVAINYASSLPNILVKSLVLCSPPLYNPEDDSHLTERQLRAMYRKIVEAPELSKVIASRMPILVMRVQPPSRPCSPGAISSNSLATTSLSVMDFSTRRRECRSPRLALVRSFSATG